MKRRVLGFGDCCYHIVSRINERRYYLREKQKTHLHDLIYRVADFSGIEILTFCIMDDHFHLLIRVPTSKALTTKELLRRLKVLYKPEEYDALANELKFYQDAGNQRFEHAFYQRYERRMYNLSEFVRTLKLRFSIWYNISNNREGPLWTSRFKSVLIQSSADGYGFRALTAVAAYIDLNAVRANLVKNAEEYTWCGFAEAVNGNKILLKGLRYIFGRDKKGRPLHRTPLSLYCKLLKSCFQHRIDCFSSNWIIGKASFVDFVARRRPECFATGPFKIAERISALPDSGLYRIKRFA